MKEHISFMLRAKEGEIWAGTYILVSNEINFFFFNLAGILINWDSQRDTFTFCKPEGARNNSCSSSIYSINMYLYVCLVIMK
jgi:hypothetical protein